MASTVITANYIKGILMNVRTAERRYILARDKANEFISLVAMPKTASYSDAPSGSPQGNATESKYILAAQYDEDMQSRLEELITARSKAENYIRMLDSNIEREVLTRRYIMYENWEQIANDIGYTLRHTIRLHGWALQKIATKCNIAT